MRERQICQCPNVDHDYARRPGVRESLRRSMESAEARGAFNVSRAIAEALHPCPDHIRELNKIY